MNKSLSSNFDISPDVLMQEIDGESVLLDLTNECYLGLNEVGTRVWQLLDDDKSLQQIHDVILQEFDVSSEQILHDLDSLITDMVDAGIVSLRN